MKDEPYRDNGLRTTKWNTIQIVYRSDDTLYPEDYSWKNMVATTTAAVNPTIVTPRPETLPDMASLAGVAPPTPSPGVAVTVVCSLVAVSALVEEVEVAVAVVEVFMPTVVDLDEFLYPPIMPPVGLGPNVVVCPLIITTLALESAADEPLFDEFPPGVALGVDGGFGSEVPLSS